MDYARPVAAWTGPVNTFDPARAPLRDGEPDYNIHPYHPRGTWRRALLFLSLGYRPSAEDLSALAEWNTLDAFQRKAAIDVAKDQRKATISAARDVLGPREVAGADSLARRLAGRPGVPHANAAAAILRTTGGVHSNDGGGGSGLSRMYARDLGGHLIGRSPSALAECAAERKAAQRANGRAVAHHAHTGVASRPRDEHGRFQAAS